MKYLIMKCEELGDQYECDANREPITMCDNWEKWFEENQPNYSFEVYEFNNETFTCIKHYDDCLDEGMALLYYNEEADPMFDDNFTIVKKYPNLTRYDEIPKEVEDFISTKPIYEDEDSLRSCGHYIWNGDDGNIYVYGEYYDNHYDFEY